jgi:hypothetical protein
MHFPKKKLAAAVGSGTGVTVGMWSNFTRCCVAARAAAGILDVSTKSIIQHRYTQIDAKNIHGCIPLKTWVAAVSSGTGVTVGMWSNFTRCCVAA